MDTAIEPDKDGVYQLRTNQGYRLRMNFDLSRYNGNLSNGDNFKINIPTCIIIQNNDMELGRSDYWGDHRAGLKFTDNGRRTKGVLIQLLLKFR